MYDIQDVFAVLEQAAKQVNCSKENKCQDAIFKLQEACKKALHANLDGDYEDYRQLYAINILVDNLVDSLYN